MTWTEFLGRPVFLKLGASLLHFLWQGAAIAGAFGAADAYLRRRRAGSRAHYALACGALAAMALLPVVTFARSGRDAAAVSSDASASSAAPAESPAVMRARARASAGPSWSGFAQAVARQASEAKPLFVAAWMAGVLVLSIRLLAGWRLAGRLARRATRPARPELAETFAHLARRLAVSRPVRLLESASIHVPTALGILRPVVLVPVSVIAGLDPRQLEALLAHELAHVRRHDYLVNLLQSAVETLLFYHPAVWWVSDRIRRERENCCDDLAVAVSGDARTYAGALVELEERRGARTALVLAADGGDLFRRVARLLPGPAGRTEADSRSPRVAGGIALAALLVVGAAARVSTSDGTSASPDGAVFFAAAADAGERPVIVRAARVPRKASPALAEADPAPSSASAETPPPADAGAEADAIEPAVIDGAEDVDTDDSTPTPAPAVVRVPAPDGRSLRSPSPSPSPSTEGLRAMRIHGVDGEFRDAIAALGYRNASPDDLVALKIHGVSPAEIAGMQKTFGRVSLERCVEFAIHGVSPEWLAGITAAGLKRVSPDEAVAMRIHGVTPEFLRELREAGYRDVSVDEAVSLRIHGVRPEDGRAFEAAGLSRPSLDELVAARIHGVDPGFARTMRSEGFSDAGLEELTSFRIHAVTPIFVRDIKAAGLSPLSADDAVALRIHGVTPEFVKGFRSLGLPLESADDAVAMRIHGVTESDLKELKALSYQDLSTDDLVALRIHGVTAEDVRRWNREAGTRLSVDDLVDVKVEGRRFR